MQRIFEMLSLGVLGLTLLSLVSAIPYSTHGIEELVRRRLPHQVDFFKFQLTGNQTIPAVSITDVPNDKYTVSSLPGDKILIEGNSPIALATGLHRYLADTLNVDIWQVIGSRLDTGPRTLPILSSPIAGSSVVPWRYHFNTVTFSYTTAFWTWDDWELEIDRLALRGVNLPLAMVGQEKILYDVFQEIGLTTTDIASYFSGPAYQAWNRFGNIQGSWGGNLPMEWINGQFELQKKIVQRMVDLGMTPILPAFSGAVPQGFKTVFPNTITVRNPRWQKFPDQWTNVTILSPLDPVYQRIQSSFISKQQAAFRTITHFYSLDQYNEADPTSGDPDYLRNISSKTWRALKAADPKAVWVMQAWLFFTSQKFWTDERVKAYLGGVESNEDMILLDLFAETKPLWNRLQSFYGKPWIWCQLHNFGGNMGLYGAITTITEKPIQALEKSSSLIGFGLTMEGQQGNEIMYDLLLEQAWTDRPINLEPWIRKWASRRYEVNLDTEGTLWPAWDVLRTTVYDNKNDTIECVPKSILELSPSIDGLLGRLGHHPTVFNYDLSVIVRAFSLMIEAAHQTDDLLWERGNYLYDMVDITRQALAGLFQTDYEELVNVWRKGSDKVKQTEVGNRLIARLHSLDTVLSAHDAFSLSGWINAARAQAPTPSIADFYEYNARLQMTGWGPNGEINDYASKTWGGLVISYYVPRWTIFVNYLQEVNVKQYDELLLKRRLGEFEIVWQRQKLGQPTQFPEAIRRILTVEFAKQVVDDGLKTQHS